VGERRPDAPQGLHIEWNQGRLRLEWEAVPGAAGYRVEASLLPGLSWGDVSAEGVGTGTNWECPSQSGARLFRVVALAP
jgi:hypothetical protein